MEKVSPMLILFLILQLTGFTKNPIIPNKGANGWSIIVCRILK